VVKKPVFPKDDLAQKERAPTTKHYNIIRPTTFHFLKGQTNGKKLVKLSGIGENSPPPFWVPRTPFNQGQLAETFPHGEKIVKDTLSLKTVSQIGQIRGHGILTPNCCFGQRGYPQNMRKNFPRRNIFLAL